MLDTSNALAARFRILQACLDATLGLGESGSAYVEASDKSAMVLALHDFADGLQSLMDSIEKRERDDAEFRKSVAAWTDKIAAAHADIIAKQDAQIERLRQQLYSIVPGREKGRIRASFKSRKAI